MKCFVCGEKMTGMIGVDLNDTSKIMHAPYTLDFSVKSSIRRIETLKDCVKDYLLKKGGGDVQVIHINTFKTHIGKGENGN